MTTGVGGSVLALVRRWRRRWHGCRSGLPSGFRDPRCRPLIAHPQRAVDHFQIGGRMARDLAKPSIPGAVVGDAIGIAQSIRAATDSVFRLHPMQQRHADLRAEAGAQV